MDSCECTGRCHGGKEEGSVFTKNVCMGLIDLVAHQLDRTTQFTKCITLRSSHTPNWYLSACTMLNLQRSIIFLFVAAAVAEGGNLRQAHRTPVHTDREWVSFGRSGTLAILPYQGRPTNILRRRRWMSDDFGRYSGIRRYLRHRLHHSEHHSNMA